MEFLTFFGGVWASIIIGIFVISMVIGCTYDRHYREGVKWWVFFLGVIALLCLNWQYFRNYQGVWADITTANVWKWIGIYLGVGLVYSIVEFMLDVRRSARFWSASWTSYVSATKEKFTKNVERAKIHRITEKFEAGEPVQPTNKELVDDFLSTHYRYVNYEGRIIGIVATKDAQGIVPKVNRSQLAESVGCWTIWWPFYAVSLIIGDLLTEVFRVIADVVANMSGRFVKLAFRDVFKF